MKIHINYPWGTMGPTRNRGVRPPTGGDTDATWGTGDSCGWDFGHGYNETSGGMWRSGRLASDLAVFGANGIEWVRWFVLADGFSYGHDGDLDGNVSVGDREFIPPSLTASRWDMSLIAEDFVAALRVFQAQNNAVRGTSAVAVKMMPVVCSFELARPISTFETVTNIPPAAASTGVRSVRRFKQGRSSIFRTRRDDFFRGFLDVLLDLAVPYYDQIAMWDLINEPEWMVVGRDPNIPLSDAVTFLREGIRRIRQFAVPPASPSGAVRHFKATVGYATYRAMADGFFGKAMSGQPLTPLVQEAPRGSGSTELVRTCDAFKSTALGCDIHQFHYYNVLTTWDLPEELPPNRFGPDSAFIGEIATVVRSPSDLSPLPLLPGTLLPPRYSNRIYAAGRGGLYWPGPPTMQNTAAQTLEARLRICNSKGWTQVMLWAADRTQRLPILVEIEQRDRQAGGLSALTLKKSFSDFWGVSPGPLAVPGGRPTLPGNWLDAVYVDPFVTRVTNTLPPSLVDSASTPRAYPINPTVSSAIAAVRLLT